MDFEPLQPPRGYISLASLMTAPLDTSVKVMGVIVDMMDAKQTYGTDWTCTFFIQDPSLLGSHHNQSGARIRLFRPEANMPQNVKLGDIIMIKNTLWKSVAGNNCLNDPHKRADYLFFASETIPDSTFAAPHISDENRALKWTTLPGKLIDPPTAEEQAYIIMLREWAKKHSSHLPQPNAQTTTASVSRPPPRPIANMSTTVHPFPSRPDFASRSTKAFGSAQTKSFKFAWLKDIRPDTFHDLTGEVLKIWDAGHVVDLYISDYTFNPLLFDYKENDPAADGRDGDPYGYADSTRPKRKWAGPWGRHTICIGLFDPHAAYVRGNIKEGDFVRVHNARCVVRDGSLSAKLHEDRRHPDQVDVTKLTYASPLYKEVNVQKEAYWEERRPKNVNAGSKAEKRKKKRERERLEKEKRESGQNISMEEASAGAHKENDEEEQGLFVPENSTDKINPKVIAAYPQYDTLPLSKIINSPYLNYTKHSTTYSSPFTCEKFRTRVRVVDFVPPRIEDFASSLDDPAYNDVDFPSGDPTISVDGDSSMRDSQGGWEWAFILLVEDARSSGGEKERIPLIVHGKDAVCLLGMEPVDLRHNLQVKFRLEQKLWTLWGNLAELKAEVDWTNEVKPSNHPFECCVAEFASLQEGELQRSWKIFQTVIRE